MGALLQPQCLFNGHLGKIIVPTARFWFSFLVVPISTVLALVHKSINIFVHLLTNLAIVVKNKYIFANQECKAVLIGKYRCGFVS